MSAGEAEADHIPVFNRLPRTAVRDVALARYVARSIDSLIVLIAMLATFATAGVLSYIVAPDWATSVFDVWLPENAWADYPLTSAVSLLLLVIYDGLFLSRWGMTPGKALLGIRVDALNGVRPSLRAAVKRTCLLIVTGLAFGIPLLSSIAMLVALNRLTDKRSTIWDDRAGLRVTRKAVPAWRWMLAMVGWACSVLAAWAFRYAG